MDRRDFLRTMIGGLAADAAVRTWPFRVFSFPSEIVKPRLLIGKPHSLRGWFYYRTEQGIPEFLVQPMYDIYWVSEKMAVNKQPLFNLTQITGRETRVTES